MDEPRPQLDLAEWLADPGLALCPPETRGIWIDLTAMLSISATDTLSGSLCAIARALRCDEAELRAAVRAINSTGIGFGEIRNGGVTLVNYSLSKSAIINRDSRLRKSRQREKERCHDKSCDTSSPDRYIYNNIFNSFWDMYPRKESKHSASVAFRKAKITESDLPEIAAWLEKARKSKQWQDKSMIPHPSTFLHQRRWESDPPPPPPEAKSKLDAGFLDFLEKLEG